MRLLSYVVMGYMLLAFTWWALLLHAKNEEVFEAKKALVILKKEASGAGTSEADLLRMPEYQELEEKYHRQHQMIFGEGIMFILTLLAGLWFIYRGYNRELIANQQRHNFLLAITHELKSPIASIQLVLETLQKRELPKSQADNLAAKAQLENERLLELVENLLLSARLETAYKPVFEEFNLQNLLEDLLAKLADKHPEAEFSLQASDNPDGSGQTLPPIKADKSGITSLVLNLLENAVKYSGGKPVVEVRLSETEKCFVLEFADQGIGIPATEKQRIFEKFYRIGSEETRQTKGTGLGLFIVRQIVKAHKGRLSVLDNQPKGTIFKIELPR
ncbi:MAG: HAMP domain-containing sensor histidine kinase [Bacteroidota bacterium]